MWLCAAPVGRNKREGSVPSALMSPLFATQTVPSPWHEKSCRSFNASDHLWYRSLPGSARRGFPQKRRLEGLGTFWGFQLRRQKGPIHLDPPLARMHYAPRGCRFEENEHRSLCLRDCALIFSVSFLLTAGPSTLSPGGPAPDEAIGRAPEHSCSPAVEKELYRWSFLRVRWRS